VRRIPALLAAAALVAGLAACGESGSPAPRAAATSAAAHFPVTVGAVTLDHQPEHVVSLSPTATEMLFAIGADKQVVAVDDQSDHPTQAPRSDLSGVKPNAEAIAARNPDLVVISNDMDKIVAQLAKLKIPVYLAPAANTLDDTYKQMTDLGTLTGHPDRAADLVARTKADIAKLVADTPHPATAPSYYYELDPTLYSVTSKTFVGSLFALFGASNIADPADASGAAGGYPQLSAEGVIKADPKMIFLADTKCCKQDPAAVKARPGWATVAAVKDGHVYALDDDVASRWGPRVVDLVKAIADAMHQTAG
jgi:iron complex transport system substrate-binding protein